MYLNLRKNVYIKEERIIMMTTKLRHFIFVYFYTNFNYFYQQGAYFKINVVTTLSSHFIFWMQKIFINFV